MYNSQTYFDGVFDSGYYEAYTSDDYMQKFLSGDIRTQVMLCDIQQYDNSDLRFIFHENLFPTIVQHDTLDSSKHAGYVTPAKGWMPVGTARALFFATRSTNAPTLYFNKPN